MKLIMMKKKQYRDKNRDEINAKHREKVCCPQCQKEMNKGSLTRHISTIHLKL